jgi:hypothetical protein
MEQILNPQRMVQISPGINYGGRTHLCVHRSTEMFHFTRLRTQLRRPPEDDSSEEEEGHAAVIDHVFDEDTTC